MENIIDWSRTVHLWNSDNNKTPSLCIIQNQDNCDFEGIK